MKRKYYYIECNLPPESSINPKNISFILSTSVNLELLESIDFVNISLKRYGLKNRKHLLLLNLFTYVIWSSKKIQYSKFVVETENDREIKLRFYKNIFNMNISTAGGLFAVLSVACYGMTTEIQAFTKLIQFDNKTEALLYAKMK